MLKLKDLTIWITFQYERIPQFCFRCRVIRHGATGCTKGEIRRTLGVEMKHEYGPWLWVSTIRRWPDRNKEGWGGDGQDKGDQSEQETGGAKSSTRWSSGYKGKTTGESPQSASHVNPEFCGEQLCEHGGHVSEGG